jgi:hypothetical protein
MVYNTEDYRVFGLRPSAGILKNMFHKLDLFPSSGKRVENTYSAGSVRNLAFFTKPDDRQVQNLSNHKYYYGVNKNIHKIIRTLFSCKC